MLKSAIFLVLLASSTFGAPTEKDTRITNGWTAERNQFPYQISMQWGILGIFQHICGGTLISSNTVLTAAHCITETPSLGTVRVVAGLHRIGESHSDVQTHVVTQRIVHPNYAGGVAPHDVGILKIDGFFQLNNAVQIAGLPSAGSIPSGTAVLSGWGSISTTTNPIMPEELQFIDVPIIQYEACAEALTTLMGNQGPLERTNVCTGPLQGGISACSGDSGGPLFQNGQVIGIVSWGISPCGTPGAPSVFGRVSNYNDWILSYT